MAISSTSKRLNCWADSRVTSIPEIRLPGIHRYSQAPNHTQPLVIRFISVISNHLAHGFPRLVLHPGSTLVELFFPVHVNEKTGAGLPHLDHSVARHLLWEMLHIDERSDALSKLGRDLDHLGGIGCSDFSCGWRHLIENITSLGPRTGWFGASWKPGHL